MQVITWLGAYNIQGFSKDAFLGLGMLQCGAGTVEPWGSRAPGTGITSCLEPISRLTSS